MRKVNMKQFIYFFLFFLLLTLGLFYIQGNMGTRSIKESLIQSSKNQLDYTGRMLNGVIEEANMYAVQYTADNDVKNYQRQVKELDMYSAQMKKLSIFNRLRDQLLSSQAVDDIGIYWRKEEEFIATSKGDFYVPSFLTVNKRGWEYVDNSLFFFSIYPYIRQPKNASEIEYVVGVSLKNAYLLNLLDNAVNANESKAFYLVNGTTVMSYGEMNEEIVEKVKADANSDSEKIAEFNYKTKDGDYFVLSKYIVSIDTYLITYTRTNAFLNPLHRMQQVFSISIIIILLIGISILITYYRNFYQNVYLLDKKFYQVEQGDYTTRIKENPNNDFYRLFKSFNHMVAQIHALFATLKIETDLRRKAELKQLQAQINPHFLYNSLFFIMSMAKVSPESVIKMSKHLAEYYRYLTKKESQDTTIASELELANHYLSIMSLVKNLDYEIILPHEVGNHRMMPLIIQPIVENAIQHGIEERQGAYRVIIDIKEVESGLLLAIANDGKGLTDNEIQELISRIEQETPPQGERGIGLWNINHRLKNIYGKQSKLQFSKNEWGGLTVMFFIDFTLDKEGDTHAFTNSG
ncbi:MAG: histidine kinase [Niallia nealsonii]|nr:histidine kinase [Niallia nealsonii]